jgi:hypothetical protein
MDGSPVERGRPPLTLEGNLTDYRRHDAPPRDRPKEVLSPVLRFTLYFCFGSTGLVLALKGWAAAGSIVGVYVLGVLSLSTDPKYDFFDGLDKRYRAWKVPRTQRKQKHAAEREAKAIARFEKKGWIERRTEHPIGWWLLVSGVALSVVGWGIERFTAFPYVSRTGNLALLGWAIVLALRLLQLIGLQGMADQPRGEVKYVYAKDIASLVEGWKYRAVAQLAMVLFTGACAALTLLE